MYSFPVDSPMAVLHVDIYSVGVYSGFQGNRFHLIAACAMTAFAVAESTSEQNAKSFAAALMKIMLRFGFCYTIVVDKDSKFCGTFTEVAELLHINLHVLSGGNHDPMLIERINRYLNRCLKIFCNERDSVRVAEEGILLSLYAWNSAPVAGTDISRSLVTVGREFHFPIDFSSRKHFELTSTPASVESFAKDQACLLKACGEIVKELVTEHRAMYRELINAQRPEPRLYHIGDRVLARRIVKSDKKREIVDKVAYQYSGPWEIVEKLAGSSYRIKHCDSGLVEKKHAGYLSPFPASLLPFQPLDGADNRYGQLYQPIRADPYKDAGLKGFQPYQPFQASADIALIAPLNNAFWFPTLAELSNELFPWEPGEEIRASLEADSAETLEIYAGIEPVLPPVTPQPSPPSMTTLGAAIVDSDDKLFFLAHRIPGSNVKEWCLVRVALSATFAHHPGALQDGRFLVDFYVRGELSKKKKPIFG